MKRSLLAAASALLLLFTLTPAALGADQGSYANCPTGDTTKIRIWENSIGDTTHGNDTLILCGPNWDLSQVGYTINDTGGCQGAFGNRSNWNDCASSVTVWVPSGSAICLYSDAGYTGESLRAYFVGPKAGERYNIFNDQLSSLRWSWPCN